MNDTSWRHNVALSLGLIVTDQIAETIEADVVRIGRTADELRVMPPWELDELDDRFGWCELDDSYLG